MGKKLVKMRRLFLCLLIFLTASCCSAGYSNKYKMTHKHSYNRLMKNLQLKNERYRNSLNTNRITRNEVADFDYIMDEKVVQRAATKDTTIHHEEAANAHYMKLAMLNVEHVLKTAKCQVPQRKCLHVNTMDSGNRMEYWPTCALVHKCDHDSGCCSEPKHVCSPIASKTIELFFFSINLSAEKQRGGVKMLTFSNHTACACRPRQVQILPEPQRECLCPKHFSPVPSSLECRCDCDKKHSRVCKRVKKGKRNFFTRKCRKSCGAPDCDYGDFKRDFGRCPRKVERSKRRRK